MAIIQSLLFEKNYRVLRSLTNSMQEVFTKKKKNQCRKWLARLEGEFLLGCYSKGLEGVDAFDYFDVG